MFQRFAGGESFGSACAFNDDLISAHSHERLCRADIALIGTLIGHFDSFGLAHFFGDILGLSRRYTACKQHYR